MNDIVMARTSLFHQPASQPARQPASQPARIRQSNNQFFPSENLVKKENKGQNCHKTRFSLWKKNLIKGENSNWTFEMTKKN